MDRTEIKRARTILRRVQEHLHQTHLNLGAEEQSVGFVDVVHHANSTLPHLNYVTPRRNTAWVSGKHVADGIDVLRNLERTARVRFVDGLYPPIFVRELRNLGLAPEIEYPIIIYNIDLENRPLAQPPAEVTVTPARDPQSMSLWWYLWNNAYYDVMTSGIDPLLVGRALREVQTNRQINLVLYRNRFPIGAALLTLHDNSAHLVAQAVMKEQRESALENVLTMAALRAAADAGCDLVFMVGMTEQFREQQRTRGFVDSGSIVVYAEQPDDPEDEAVSGDSQNVQSVLVV